MEWVQVEVIFYHIYIIKCFIEFLSLLFSVCLNYIVAASYDMVRTVKTFRFNKNQSSTDVSIKVSLAYNYRN